jgi:superfamily II DNA/RNA helicase
MLARILQAENSGSTIVFTRTKRAAQRVADDLAERGFPASPLHGDMAQIAREKAMAKFRERKVRVLVATDVAARGIDVSDVTHVINYSCPEDENTYVHRIGRTGRAGASGVAITFVDWADVTRWKVINKALGLPFDEPLETYSTSENFFHDLGIPRGVKGRLVDPTPAPASERKPERKREESERTPRQRNRSRSRTRSGQPVEGTEPKADSGPGNGTGSTEGGEKRPARKRSRSRSRSGSGEKATPAAD